MEKGSKGIMVALYNFMTLIESFFFFNHHKPLWGGFLCHLIVQDSPVQVQDLVTNITQNVNI